MSLLTLVRSVCRLVKVVQPSSVVNSTDPNVLQLWELANEEGNDLASSFNWQALQSEYSFTTAAAQFQPNAVPGDLDHFVPNTFWNRTTDLPMRLVDAQEWQALQAYPGISTSVLCFRQRHGGFLTYPAPPAGQTVAYEYVSNGWCAPAGGATTLASTYAQDGDTAALDEQLMALGLRWRFLKANGLDYAEDFRTYESNKAQTQARDGPSTAINLSRDSDRYTRQIPETGFGGIGTT